MKWSIAQLTKLTLVPYQFSTEYDFTLEAQDVSDIISISIAHVKGTITRVDTDTFGFDYQISVDLVLACALTLEPVDFHLDLKEEDLFGPQETDTILPIVNNTIDMRAMVWDNILVAIPIRVIRDDAYEILAKRKIVLDEKFSEDDENDENEV